MKYFMFIQRWSQTDQEYCLVQAEEEQAARAKIKSNARYIDRVGVADKLIK